MQMFRVSKTGGTFIFDPMRETPGPDCPQGEIVLGDNGPELLITKGHRRFWPELQQTGSSIIALKESDAADLVITKGMEHAFTKEHHDKIDDKRTEE